MEKCLKKVMECQTILYPVNHPLVHLLLAFSSLSVRPLISPVRKG